MTVMYWLVAAAVFVVIELALIHILERKIMKGKLYGIGVGPGDPELLTLKAKRLIEECDIVAVPVKKEGEDRCV